MLFLLGCLGEGVGPSESASESALPDSDPPVLWSLTIEGEDYPHIGQQLGLNVVRDDEVVAQEFLVFEDNTFRLELGAVLLDGAVHTIDWYADADEDEACSEGDHAWTFEMLPALEDEELSLPHVNGRPYDIEGACSHF